MILQKRVVRIITFSKYDEHSSPLFKQLDILKITDLISLHNALLMYDFHYYMLPPQFDKFFKQVKNVHNNLIEDNLKKMSKSSFKKAIKSNIVNAY